MVLAYIIAAIMVVVTVVLLLCAFGPLHSQKPFWQFIYRVRAVMDAISYYFMTACLILSAIAAVVYFVSTKLLR